jgi:FkbM family methyltransferase
MASAGRRSLVAAGLTRARLALRSRLVQRIRVSDGEYVHVFRCEDPLEVTRAVTLLEKEPGTIRFIRTEVRPGDVFYDIGANIGLYTLAAGRRVGDDGMVCAFEPHAANVMNLLRNVAENGLGGRVKVVSAALNDSSGFFPFDYRSAEPGSALSRLESEGATGEEFAPVFSELKYATSVDALVADGVIPPSDLVKLDVDGNELHVLRGMRAHLSGEHRPRAVQVEIDPETREQVYAVMREHGYELGERHDTMGGRALMESGHGADEVVHNVVFRARPTA